MSSGVDSGGVIAVAVLAPVAVAFGAGWLAWQGGKLLVEANRAVDREVAEKKRQIEEAEKQRKLTALAAHNQLVDMCKQIIEQLEQGEAVSGIMDYAQTADLKLELQQICLDKMPDETSKIESLNSLGYIKLESVINKQRRLAEFKLSDTNMGLYSGLSVADLMDDLRIVFAAMTVRETIGTDVRAADPLVLERAKLNSRLEEVAGRIMVALEYVEDLARNYGLSEANKAWFHSCFNGVDIQIQQMCKPTTPNAELKKGIKRLEELMSQYDMLIPSIEQQQQQLVTLYSVYVDASKALGEPVLSMKHFKTVSALEEKMQWLNKRAERAKECAQIYKKLGPSAYMCYAWDEELKALGYSVHTRKKITEMAKYRPEHAKLGEYKLPFYEWDQNELTQIYSVSDECALQLIVHSDGSVSMQMVSENDDANDTRKTQKAHCEQMQRLHERLRQNWFIMYDYHETISPDVVTSVESWQVADDNAWRQLSHTPERDKLVTEQRKNNRANEQLRMKQ